MTKENDQASLTDASFQMAAHQHDAWEGEDRPPFLDEARAVGPQVSDGWIERFVSEDGGSYLLQARVLRA